MRATTVLVALGLVLSTAGATASLAGPVTETPLESRIQEIRTDPGPEDDARVATFVGETTYTGSGPVNAAPAVSDTRTLEPEDVPEAAGETPYQYLFRAAPVVRGTHGTTLQPAAGFTHHAWYYAGLAEASYVRAGESMENLVGVTAPEPLFPPRGVSEGGQLAWEDVEDLTSDVETTEWDPESETWETASSTATGFAAVLRVDGGGLVAEGDVTSPELRIPIGEEFSGLAATVRPTALPGVSYDIDSGFATEADGSSYYSLQVTVDDGSRWPESGDEAPGGTWKLVVRGFAMTWPDSTTHEELDRPARIQAELASVPPGTNGVIETTDGDREPLPNAAGIGFEAGPETVRVLDHTPWPTPSERSDETGAEGSGVSPSSEACGTDHRSPAHADLQDEGALSFDLSASSTSAEDVCIRGTPVGSFGLPAVEVDGQLHFPSLVEDAPQIRDRHYVTSEGYGTQAVLTFLADAGPIRYTATLPLDADESGGGFLLSIDDFHALDGHRHDIRFVWAMDADAGPGERFHAYDEAPMLTEGVLAEPGPGAALAVGSQQHTVTSGQADVDHTFEAATPAALTVVAEEGLEELFPTTVGLFPVFPPEALAAPPEPLVDRDVAFLAPHPMEGAYQGWMTNRGNLVDRGLAEVPLGGGALASAGFLIANAYAGQLGFTGFHTVEAP